MFDEYIHQTSVDYIVIDKNYRTFANDITFSTLNEQEKLKESPYKNDKEKSKLLTVISSILSYINEKFEIQLYQTEYNIKMLKYSLETTDKITRLLLNSELFIYEANYRELLKLYRILHNVSSVYRDYHLALFYYIDSLELSEKRKYLSYIPVTILNIFSSCLIFIDEDESFLEFINDSMSIDTFVPRHYRLKYLSAIYNMSANKFQVYFQPDIELLINDVINIFPKYLEDSFYFNDIHVLTNIINLYFSNDESYDRNILIKYVSVQAYILSRIENERKTFSLEKYINLLLTHINNINLIITLDETILNSYLLYYLAFIINNIISEKDNLLQSLVEPVRTIFSYIIVSDLGLKYMKSIGGTYDYLSIKSLSYILEHDINEDSLDPLTELPIIQKCIIPPNQVCDKYMIESYIWIKEENPFTRSKLTVDDIENEEIL